MQIDKIVFCVFLDKDLHIYRELLPKYFPDFLDATLLHAKVTTLKRLSDFIVEHKQIIAKATERLETVVHDTSELIKAHLAALDGTEELSEAKEELKAAEDLIRLAEGEAIEF